MHEGHRRGRLDRHRLGSGALPTRILLGRLIIGPPNLPSLVAGLRTPPGVKLRARTVTRIVVDEDEIDSLIWGREYIKQIDRSVTPFGNSVPTPNSGGQPRSERTFFSTLGLHDSSLKPTCDTLISRRVFLKHLRRHFRREPRGHRISQHEGHARSGRELGWFEWAPHL